MSSVEVSVSSSSSSSASASTPARRTNPLAIEATPGDNPAPSRIGLPSHADGDDLDDVLGFVREHAVGMPADQSIKLPLPRVRCIDLLRVLRNLHEESLHPFSILHARSRPLFRALDFKNERDLTEMAFLVEQLRLPPSLIIKIRQYKASMDLRVTDPWFDSGNGGGLGGGSGAEPPNFAGFVGELTDLATSFTESILGWWRGKKDSDAAAANKSQRQTSAAALVEATRGSGRLRARLSRDPVLKPLWDAVLAALSLLEVNGTPAQLDDAFLDGLCADPFTPASSATVAAAAAVGAGASAPSLGGAGSSGGSGAAAPASHAGNKDAVEPGFTAQSRYLAGRLAAGHSLPRGVRYEASMANDSLPLQAAAAVGNVPALKDLMGGGWKFDRNVSASAAKNGQVEVLKWIASADCEANLDGGQVFDASTCAAAALAPSSEALQWLREKGVEWDCRTVKAALAAGNKETLEWARTQKCPEF